MLVKSLLSPAGALLAVHLTIPKTLTALKRYDIMEKACGRRCSTSAKPFYTSKARIVFRHLQG